MQKKSSLNPFLKLKAIVNLSYNGDALFTDRYKVRPSRLNLCSGQKFRLYTRYMHLTKDITKEQFLEMFPDVKQSKIDRWHLTIEKNWKFS
mmetsp:Transcript_42752/g.50100  ORF Transcript_42752/g.50100 Transcript_42752/m.50100 type:complete len:91 (+) Transcript_42752:170-442(+)